MSDVEGLVDWVDSLWTTPCPHGGSYARDCYRCIHETLYASPWLAARVQAARAEAAEVVESYRRKNPMNGDGSNYTIDRILRELVGEDERDRLKGEHQTRWNEEYLEFTARAAALRADDAGGEGL